MRSFPTDFHIHPKLEELLEQRAEMGHGKRADGLRLRRTLAFGSLVLEGTPIRLTGQDSQRGTFNQRHAVLDRQRNRAQVSCRSRTRAEQAFCEIYNSPLSEAGVLGFEYGFSRDYPEALVLWEAQFGDFVNGAQIIIDQFFAPAKTSGPCRPAWCCCCRMATRARVRSTPARASSAFCNSPPKTTSTSASLRMPRNIFTCCDARRSARGASR